MITAAAPAPGAVRTSWLVAAFAAVYLIWGSTYLAIRVLVAAMPPLFVAGLRSATAGAGSSPPSRSWYRENGGRRRHAPREETAPCR